MKKRLLSLTIALVTATSIIQAPINVEATTTKTLVDTKKVNNMTLTTYKISGELAEAENYIDGYSKLTKPSATLRALVSPISQFIGSDGGFTYAYNLGLESKDIVITKENGTILTLEKVAPLLGGVAQDENGYYYVVSGMLNGENNTTNVDVSDIYDTNINTVFITKYSEDGKLIKTASFSGNFMVDDTFNTQNPFRSGNCDIAIHNGVLVVSYGRQMYNGHQMKDALAVNTSDMSQTYNGITRKLWVSHSFDQRVIWLNRSNSWLFVDHGDANPRSFVADLYDGSDTATRNKILDFDGDKGDNFTNAQMGGIVETTNGVMFVGASGKNGNQDVEQQLFVAMFEPTTGQVSDLKWFQNTGIIEPQIVRCGEDLNVILWKEEIFGTSVFARVLDDEGNIVVDKTELKNTTLNDNEDPIFANNKIQWVTVEETGVFKYELSLESLAKITEDKEAVPSSTNFMLNNEDVYLPAYSINGEDYVNISDIATLFKNKFNVVTIGNKVEIYKDEEYTPNGGELKPLSSGKKTAKLSTTNYLIGETGGIDADVVYDLISYKIDGKDYVKLSDLAYEIGFDVAIEGNKTSINSTTEKVLQTGYYYIQILNQYIYLDPNSRMWITASPTKPEKPFYIEYLGTDSVNGPKYTISYEGKYMVNGLPDLDFDEDNEYLWGISLDSNHAIINDYYSPDGIIAASKLISSGKNIHPYVCDLNVFRAGNYEANATFTKVEGSELEEIKQITNRVEVYDSSKSSVQPLVISGISYLPIRALIEDVLGGRVNYNSSTGTIEAIANGRTFETNMEDTIIYRGVTHLGLRTFSQGLGYEVEYDPTTKSIHIYSK